MADTNSVDALDEAAWKLSAYLKRCWIWMAIAALGGAPIIALADDWGMGDANSRIPPSA